MHTNSPAILVVGGTGFIGSHMSLLLKQSGFTPIILDNLSKSHTTSALDTPIIIGEMNDRTLLNHLFHQYQFAAVMHFASFIEVAESVRLPLLYYRNNVCATVALLEVMLKHQVKHFIFSSTAAVYGNPIYTPIDEAHPLQPINPYGASKRMVEEIIQHLGVSDQLNYAILRYFNAAGADPCAILGEQHEPESHLIPLVLQVALRKKDAITIYGQDYATPDGTCIRDYIHVIDLCSAHLLALQKLLSRQASILCNLGTGQGYSVKQVIETASHITQRPIPIIQGQRRLGDPAILVADSTKAKQYLSWQPKHSDLATIIQHAWNFYCQYDNHLSKARA